MAAGEHGSRGERVAEENTHTLAGGRRHRCREKKAGKQGEGRVEGRKMDERVSSALCRKSKREICKERYMAMGEGDIHEANRTKSIIRNTEKVHELDSFERKEEAA